MSTPTCADLRHALLSYVSTSFTCREYDEGISYETPLRHSDGDTIELFIALRQDGLYLTDRGDTFDRIDTAGFDLTEDRRAAISAMATDAGAIIDGWEVCMRVSTNHALGDRLWRFAQLVSNISALAYRHGGADLGAFRRIVKTTLANNAIPVFDGFQSVLVGNYHGRSYRRKLNFPLALLNERIPVQLISADTKNSQGPQVNRAFRNWTEYAEHYPGPRVTIINDLGQQPTLATLHVLDSVSVVLTMNQVSKYDEHTFEKILFSKN